MHGNHGSFPSICVVHLSLALHLCIALNLNSIFSSLEKLTVSPENHSGFIGKEKEITSFESLLHTWEEHALQPLSI
ncbi:unnamed protein product [Lathyrus oleraceus]